MSKNRIDLAHQIVVANFLQDDNVLRKLDSNTCVYAAGWSDDKVASHLALSLSTHITGNNVAGVREKLYGKTVIRPNHGSSPELQQRLEKLEADLAAACSRLDDQQIRIAKLELKLKHG